MFDDLEPDLLDDEELEEMEPHIWRLIMEKQILLTVISVVLLAVMTISKVGLIQAIETPDAQAAEPGLQDERLFVRCEGGRLDPYESEDPIPADLAGRRVVLVLDPEAAACVRDGFSRGAGSFVFAEVEAEGDEPR